MDLPQPPTSSAAVSTAPSQLPPEPTGMRRSVEERTGRKAPAVAARSEGPGESRSPPEAGGNGLPRKRPFLRQRCPGRRILATHSPAQRPRPCRDESGGANTVPRNRNSEAAHAIKAGRPCQGQDTPAPFLKTGPFSGTTVFQSYVSVGRLTASCLSLGSEVPRLTKGCHSTPRFTSPATHETGSTTRAVPTARARR